MPFTRLDPLPTNRSGEFLFEGHSVRFAPGDMVAGALLAAGVIHFRETPVSGSQRGPWCLMGICFECLVTIDGQDNLRACTTPAQAGMDVRRQTGARHDAMESPK